MFAHNCQMRKQNKPKQNDRHKPRRMVGIKESLAEQLDKLVERNASGFTTEVNRAVRELLAREGFWPPSGD